VSFANRLRKNHKHLRRWAEREGTDAFRVYDRDMPEYPVVVEWYAGRVQVQLFPRREPDAAPLRDEVGAAIEEVLGVPAARIHWKTHRPHKWGESQYEREGDRGERFTVTEHGLKLWVNLGDYLDTGLFLDHRPMRMRIQKEAAGKRFLNLYCYTATASVHAAKGGARTTTSVDLSKTYLDWARRNLSLNGFSDKNRLEQGDVMAWLEASRDEYDLIFIDPPTFSNSKRMEGIFDVQRDQVQLIDLAMARLAPGGVLYFSNNFRKFTLEENLAERYAVEEITAQTIDPDFARNGKIHRAWKITAR
jgi:23S rRNA (guanine2445-N2)-methyltransferase / 23S rRNA (guanine2069-N7)-methyltransferase